jgi:hypothetical protein
MACSALLLITAIGLLPELEKSARAMPLISAVLDGFAQGWRCLRMVEWTMALAAGAGAWIFQARCLQVCYPDTYDPRGLAGPGPAGRQARGPPRRRAIDSPRRKKHGLVIGDMPVEYDDLRTSILVTGVTGSSKTAGVLMPAVAQLLQTYHAETADERSRDEFQKLGAFIPEVKGDLVDGCIYLAHEAGRCVSRDVLILSPACRIPVVRYRDERGRCWFLSGRGGAGGSDAGEILPRATFPDGHHRAGRLVPGNVFESAADTAAVVPQLAQIRIALGDRRPRFIGWRWAGDALVRVSRTEARDQPIPLPGADGKPYRAVPPQTLTIDGVVYIDNGVHYNLVDPRLPAAEAAERLTRLAAMARGGSSRGENDYFYEQGRKVITACIALHRAVESTVCTAGDIVRLATQDQRLASALGRLAGKLEQLRNDAAALPEGEEKSELQRRQIGPLEDLWLFFRDEWQKMVADGKTANVIKSTISGAFDVFLQDPNLAETFCQPSTFSFEDIPQAGKIIGLVPGDQYEQLGRLLGTACKLDFQSTLLARNGRADLNASRLVLYFADECHKYIISGSATAGDPYFMNLSRSNNIVNICATQSYAWIVEVIGREAANVYISAFGVQFWLQQTDPETCRRAAEICGTITRENAVIDHDFNFTGCLGALAGGKDLVIRHQIREEKEERFRAEDFAHLDVGDIIAYNKGRPGRTAKVTKGRAAYIFCTQKPDGTAAVTARVREYYREILENLTYERGQASRWACEAAPPVDQPALLAEDPPPSPEYRLTQARIERERAAFRAGVGSLDAAVAETTRIDAGQLATAWEEARLLGDDLAPTLDLKALRVEQARRERGRDEDAARMDSRHRAPHPLPAADAFDLATLHHLRSG